MKPLCVFISFLLMAICVKGQQESDTTGLIKGNFRMEISLPQNSLWVQMKDSGCLTFDYPTPFITLLTSKCSGTQNVTLKRKKIDTTDGEPLLDVPRQKKQ